MYKLQDWAAVQRVYKQTGSKRKTAKILHMSRNTVRALLKQSEEPVYNSNHRKSCIDPFQEDVITWRGPPYNYNGTRIFRELQKIGYSGSKGPLYRLLRRIDEDICILRCPAAAVAVLNSRRAVSNRSACGSDRSVNCCAV